MQTFSSITGTHRKPVVVLLASMLAVALVGFSGPVAAEPSPPLPQAPEGVSCPGGQCFQDVPSSSTFYEYVNNLYMDGIISGYACGSNPDEPCVAPANRPYYRPAANVTRAQMTKFVDLGRRNIANATGKSLFLSTEASGFLAAALVAQCVNGGCTSVVGLGQSGGRAALFSGGTGVSVTGYDPGAVGLDVTSENGLAANFEGDAGIVVTATEASSAGVNVRTSGTGNSPAVLGTSQNSVGLRGKTHNAGSWSLYVDPAGPSTGADAAGINGGLYVAGNLTVAGSKSGYVVDVMRNAGSGPLEVGDVVEIVGSSDPVLGEIPVVTVRKTSKAYSTGVVGVVDQAVYVPSAALISEYERQKRDQDAALAKRAELQARGGKENMAAAAAIQVPEVSIGDKEVIVHSIEKSSGIGNGEYLNAVTLGSFKAIKVDAGYGAVQAGDLLVSSPHAGYAMKADPAQAAVGTVIGKALGSLDSGTGTLPVMITLK